MATVGLGILSWRAHETLRKTLESLSIEFLACFHDKVIYFQDIDTADRKIAAEFGFRAEGGPNEGIGYGMMHVVDVIQADYAVVLQNDCPLIVPAKEAVAEIAGAIRLLETKQADLVRLRHRWLGGELFGYPKKYLKVYGAKSVDKHFRPELYGIKPSDYKDTPVKKLRRIAGYVKAKRLRGSAVFVEQFPQIIHGDVIKKTDEFYIIDSSVLYFSDQPFMIEKEFFMNTLWKYGASHASSANYRNGKMGLEESLHTAWWREQHFKIAQGTGLFTHQRWDRPHEQDMERLLNR